VSGNHKNGGIFYSSLAGFYDPLFQWVQFPKQKMLIRRMNIRPGAQVMDLGVGNGKSLRMYPPHARVTGIDISPKMLLRARKRVGRHKLRNVKIYEMDAHDIDKSFAPSTFDCFNASFVMSVVNDPLSALRNMVKVGKPDCTIFMLNHNKSRHPFWSRVEKHIEPACRKIGWKYGVDVPSLIAEAGLDLLDYTPCFPYDLYVAGRKN